MGKKKTIKSGAPSLADLPRDIRGLIADYVEKTWVLTPKGKRWTGCSVSSVATAVRKNKRDWAKKRNALLRLPMDGDFGDDIRRIYRKHRINDDLRVKIVTLDKHAASLKARKDLAYRQGLLIRKCKRANL